MYVEPSRLSSIGRLTVDLAALVMRMWAFERMPFEPYGGMLAGGQKRGATNSSTASEERRNWVRTPDPVTYGSAADPVEPYSTVAKLQSLKSGHYLGLYVL